MSKNDAEWADYRARIALVFGSCWECLRPCPECRAWARARAFGREPTSDYADAIEETYRAAGASRAAMLSAPEGE